MFSILVTSFSNLFILPPINVCQMLMQTRNSIHVSHRANMREETAFTVQSVIERKRSLLHVGGVSSNKLNKPPALSIPAHIQGFVCVQRAWFMDITMATSGIWNGSLGHYVTSGRSPQ